MRVSDFKAQVPRFHRNMKIPTMLVREGGKEGLEKLLL